ncbi:hypothetical protein [Butyrivibrio hungatei]|uniref:Uncharacterized protein n=1 Tax=Butyrivibrio hungatei TaxID=185008 RepID=A0A1D9P5W5_9FIRM|nr:hypothetical protein [Butyrivibrio hungatei]AOZ97929.1 hypothetical protein bhn_II130 [Butyrivibrio hungatei]
MKKLNMMIEYTKLVIVLNLFLLGSIESEPPKATLIFLLSTLILSIALEILFIKIRQTRQLKYERYLCKLERIVSREVKETDNAA